MDAPVSIANMMPETSAAGAFDGPKETVRTYFPETWIWDLVPVGDTGKVNVEKTVPDTITKWAAGAFCTSSVGFGLAPNTGLTAFQPFFVSLMLPYSVIRGEVFTLKATVFNYLSKCIMLKNDPTVKRFDLEEGHVIIYLDGLKQKETKTYSLAIEEDVPVRNLKPAVVKVYDYYQTNDEAVSEYSSPCAEK